MRIVPTDFKSLALVFQCLEENAPKHHKTLERYVAESRVETRRRAL